MSYCLHCCAVETRRLVTSVLKIPLAATGQYLIHFCRRNFKIKDLVVHYSAASIAPGRRTMDLGREQACRDTSLE